MLADEHPEMGVRGPGAYGGSPVMLHVYLEAVDEVVERAVAAGAEVVRPLQDQFYGDRTCLFTDPFGHSWNVATHIEDVAPEELARRAAECGKGGDS
jgi:PhnB protein